MNEFYACWFRLGQIDQYLIWRSSDPDSVLLDEDGRIPVFFTETELAQYARSKAIDIVNHEPRLLNLDAVEQWLHDINSHIDCADILGAWNFFMDVSYALNAPFKGNQDYTRPRNTLRDRVYDKLFYGNNIYNMTPDGTYYIPVWESKERRKIAEIIADGLALFRRSIKPVRLVFPADLI